jgi:hypothetical protein
MRTGSVRAALAAMAVVGMGLWGVAPAALAQPAFQAPPVLRARELLPPDMLAGPHFQVDDRVPEERELVGAVRPGEVAGEVEDADAGERLAHLRSALPAMTVLTASNSLRLSAICSGVRSARLL